jgi:hypothetical protein
MPKHITASNPGLTSARLQEIFEKKFSETYKIYTSNLPLIDFVVKKSDFTGISVKLKQKVDKTIIQYGAFAPAFWVRFLLYGLIPLIILYMGPWKKMQEEVKEFLESNHELNK